MDQLEGQVCQDTCRPDDPNPNRETIPGVQKYVVKGGVCTKTCWNEEELPEKCPADSGAFNCKEPDESSGDTPDEAQRYIDNIGSPCAIPDPTNYCGRNGGGYEPGNYKWRDNGDGTVVCRPSCD